MSPPSHPRSVSWTEHALAKALLLNFSRSDVENAILVEHAKRSRNTGAADWLVTIGRLVVAYNHPDDDDATVARVVTVWRRA